jgi:hypothetical protein
MPIPSGHIELIPKIDYRLFIAEERTESNEKN